MMEWNTTLTKCHSSLMTGSVSRSSQISFQETSGYPELDTSTEKKNGKNLKMQVELYSSRTKDRRVCADIPLAKCT